MNLCLITEYRCVFCFPFMFDLTNILMGKYSALVQLVFTVCLLHDRYCRQWNILIDQTSFSLGAYILHFSTDKQFKT